MTAPPRHPYTCVFIPLSGSPQTLKAHLGTMVSVMHKASIVESLALHFLLLLFFKVCLFERESEHAGEAEGGERISSRLHAEHGTPREAQSHNPEITT